MGNLNFCKRFLSIEDRTTGEDTSFQRQMLRLLTRSQAFRAVTYCQRPIISSRCIPIRNFQFSPILAKKNKAKGGNKNKSEVQEIEEDNTDNQVPEIDFDDATNKFKGVIERFSKQANEAKLGKTSPNIFDKLIVETANGEVGFTSVAQTTVKGRNFMITVFDPSNVKSIINAVLGSDLNMNPQIDPSNKQTLKVPLPPLTTESKKENAKQLKLVYERFKNGSGRANGSLATIRGDVKNKFQKQHKKKKLSDAEEKVFKDFEKLHKQYTDKLTEVFKSAEQAILK